MGVKKILMLLLCLGLVGCASTWTRFEPFNLTQEKLPPKSKNYQMALEAGEPLNRKYEKLGVVWSSWYTYSSAADHVREKAKKIGADAVINVQSTTYPITVGTASFTTGAAVGTAYQDGYPKVVGIAIKFLDNVDHTEYSKPNVVEPIQADKK